MDNRTNLFTAYLGRNSFRERLFVEVDTRTEEAGKLFQTVNHEHTSADNVNLSVTYYTLRYRTSRGGSFGNGGGLAEQVSAMTEIADGWTTADVQSLAEIAKRWHLNDMRPACAHMPADAVGRTWNPETRTFEGGTVCPETGYIYGTAWLTEEIPADVWTELAFLSRLPRGTIQKPID